MKKILGLLFIVAICLTVLAACSGDDVEICFHEWEQAPSEETVYTPATCRTSAVYYSTCKECGAKGAQFSYGDAVPHSFTENVKEELLVSAATCTSRPSYYKSCEFCGLANDEVFVSGETLAHNFVKKASVETLVESADCTRPNKYCLSCEDCGEKSATYFTLGPARPHEDSEGDLMCDHCNVALEVFKDDTPIDNLTGIHQFGKKED